MCWNVRGLNSKEKWNAIKDKVIESGCDVVCFQETKKEQVDVNFIKNVCPISFDKFEFLPSVGASGGILTAWKSSLFRGQLAFTNEFALSVEFYSLHNNDSWLLINVYGPCIAEGKRNFMEWFQQIQMLEFVD